MKRANSLWFECSAGHVTAGDTVKKVCDAELWQYYYEKGKRKTWKLEEKKIEKKCGCAIVKSGEIPSEIDYGKVWDYPTAHAFCIGQKLDAEFIIGLQKVISSIMKRLPNES